MRRNAAPLREREFRLLFAGRTISLVALAFAVDLTGSKTDLGLILACHEIPSMLFLLVGGIWADRLPRNKVMVSAKTSRFLSEFAVRWREFRSRDWSWSIVLQFSLLLMVTATLLGAAAIGAGVTLAVLAVPGVRTLERWPARA